MMSFSAPIRPNAPVSPRTVRLDFIPVEGLEGLGKSGDDPWIDAASGGSVRPGHLGKPIIQGP